MATQVTTYLAESSPAHVNMDVKSAVAEYEKRGYKVMSEAPNLRAGGFYYIMWNPETYATVEIYEDGM